MADDRPTRTGPDGDPRRRYDLSKVVPPTLTPEPDSIIGGTPTTDFPECCAVGGERGYFCSGTLIAPTVVVTARHCEFVDRVFIGGSDLGDPSDGEEIIVAEQYAHDDDEVDLRVLVLEAAAATPPCHVAQGLEASGARAMLVGFGTIDYDGEQGYGIKRKVEVDIQSLDCGSVDVAGRFGCKQGLELVAGHRGLNRDTCRGDSGGPLYIQSSQGNYFLLGATSRGIVDRDSDRLCGDGGIYVRVDRHLDWIRAVSGVEIEGPLY